MKDVTRLVITEDEIKNTIGRIFTDGVILSRPYTIISVGKNICNLLDVSEDSLSDAPLSDLTGSSLSESKLTALLNAGYFEEYEITLENIDVGESIHFMLSGFYLGLIADINDLVILKFEVRNNAEALLKQLHAKSLELDDFIYATSHDLRGPLATLKGLIGLMQMPGRKNYKFLADKMSHFANKLDDRLHKLIYFAESDKESEYSEQLSLNEIVHGLTKPMEDEHSGAVSPQFSLPAPSGKLKHGKLILTLLSNIKSFFIQNGARNREIEFYASQTEISYEFKLAVKDILLTIEQRKKFEVVNFGYTEILSDPHFTDIYSAKKITLKLQGSLKLQTEGQKVLACVSLPQG